jgi:hypothetical protein
MAIDFRGDSSLEMDALMSKSDGLGIDGLFVDCSISATRWKEGFMQAYMAAHESDGDDKVPVQRAAAIATLVLVGALIVACGVYAWKHKQSEGDGHGSYKAMTSPHVGDDMVSISVHSSCREQQDPERRLAPQQDEPGEIESKQ